MTVVVGVSNGSSVFVGGDSFATDSESGQKVELSVPKVFQKDEFFVGYAGSLRFGKAIQYSVDFPKVPSWAVGRDKLDEFVNRVVIPSIRKQLNEAETDERNERPVFNLLIGVRGHLFEVDSDWAAYQCDSDFVAIGSGGSVAAGSLYSTRNLDVHPADRVHLALEAASKFNAFCGGKFTILGN